MVVESIYAVVYAVCSCIFKCGCTTGVQQTAAAFKFGGHYKSHSHSYPYTAESTITVTLVNIMFEMPWVLYMICTCQFPAVWGMPTPVLGPLRRRYLNSDKPQQVFVYTTISTRKLCMPGAGYIGLMGDGVLWCSASWRWMPRYIYESNTCQNAHNRPFFCDRQ